MPRGLTGIILIFSFHCFEVLMPDFVDHRIVLDGCMTRGRSLLKQLSNLQDSFLIKLLFTCLRFVFQSSYFTLHGSCNLQIWRSLYIIPGRVSPCGLEATVRPWFWNPQNERKSKLSAHRKYPLLIHIPICAAKWTCFTLWSQEYDTWLYRCLALGYIPCL